jgi:hypothetical protein
MSTKMCKRAAGNLPGDIPTSLSGSLLNFAVVVLADAVFFVVVLGGLDVVVVVVNGKRVC